MEPFVIQNLTARVSGSSRQVSDGYAAEVQLGSAGRGVVVSDETSATGESLGDLLERSRKAVVLRGASVGALDGSHSLNDLSSVEANGVETVAALQGTFNNVDFGVFADGNRSKLRDTEFRNVTFVDPQGDNLDSIVRALLENKTSSGGLAAGSSVTFECQVDYLGSNQTLQIKLSRNQQDQSVSVEMQLGSGVPQEISCLQFDEIVAFFNNRRQLASLEATGSTIGLVQAAINETTTAQQAVLDSLLGSSSADPDKVCIEGQELRLGSEFVLNIDKVETLSTELRDYIKEEVERANQAGTEIEEKRLILSKLAVEVLKKHGGSVTVSRGAGAASDFSEISLSSEIGSSKIEMQFSSDDPNFSGGKVVLDAKKEDERCLNSIVQSMMEEGSRSDSSASTILDAFQYLKEPLAFENVRLRLDPKGASGGRSVLLTTDPTKSNRLVMRVEDLGSGSPVTRLEVYSDGLSSKRSTTLAIISVGLAAVVKDAEIYGYKRAEASERLNVGQRDLLLAQALTSAHGVVLTELNTEIVGYKHQGATSTEQARKVKLSRQGDAELYKLNFEHQGDPRNSSASPRDTRLQFNNQQSIQRILKALQDEAGIGEVPDERDSLAYDDFLSNKGTEKLLRAFAENASRIEQMWFTLPDSILPADKIGGTQLRDREVFVEFNSENSKYNIYIDGKLAEAFQDARGTDSSCAGLNIRDLVDGTYHDLPGKKFNLHCAQNQRDRAVLDEIRGNKFEVNRDKIFGAIDELVGRMSDIGGEPGLLERNLMKQGVYPMGAVFGLRQGQHEHDVRLVEIYNDAKGLKQVIFHPAAGSHGVNSEPVIFQFDSDLADVIKEIHAFNEQIVINESLDPKGPERRINDLFTKMSDLGGMVINRKENINIINNAGSYSQPHSPIADVEITELNDVTIAKIRTWQVDRNGRIVGSQVPGEVEMVFKGSAARAHQQINEALQHEHDYQGDPRKSEFFTRLTKQGGWEFSKIGKGAHVYLSQTPTLAPNLSAFTRSLDSFDGTIHMMSTDGHQLEVKGKIEEGSSIMTATYVGNGAVGHSSEMTVNFKSTDLGTGIQESVQAFTSDLFSDGKTGKTARGVIYVGAQLEGLMWRAINEGLEVSAENCNIQLMLKNTVRKDQDFSNLNFSGCILEVNYEGKHLEMLKHDGVQRLLEHLCPRSYGPTLKSDNDVDLVMVNLRSDLVLHDLRLAGVQIKNGKVGSKVEGFTMINCEADYLEIGPEAPARAIAGLAIEGCVFHKYVDIRVQSNLGRDNFIVNSYIGDEGFRIDAPSVNGFNMLGTETRPPEFVGIAASYNDSAMFIGADRTREYAKYTDGLVFSPDALRMRNALDRARSRRLQRTIPWYYGLGWQPEHLNHHYGLDRIPGVIAKINKNVVDRTPGGSIFGGRVELVERPFGHRHGNYMGILISPEQAAKCPGLRAGQYNVRVSHYVASFNMFAKFAESGSFGAFQGRIDSLAAA